jgi:hypothetical protein
MLEAGLDVTEALSSPRPGLLFRELSVSFNGGVK